MVTISEAGHRPGALHPSRTPETVASLLPGVQEASAEMLTVQRYFTFHERLQASMRWVISTLASLRRCNLNLATLVPQWMSSLQGQLGGRPADRR